MDLKRKEIKFKKDGEEKTMSIFYVEINVNGKQYQVQLELYRPNNFLRKLLEEELKK